jgi:hypothetical protein
MLKKIIILIGVLILVFLIGQQLFWYAKHEGNVIVYISNQSELDTVNIELYLDGNKIESGFFTNASFHDYKKYPLKINFGTHTLLLKAKETSTSKEISFTAFLMKWVIVDFSEVDKTIGTGTDSVFTFLTTKQLTPLVIE